MPAVEVTASDVRLPVDDAERPSFHLMPKQGWLNDPNGPLYYQGHYHVFYQHVPEGSEWQFGLVWGHATSRDLVHWQHQPAALTPTPGTLDADGCFSGCATIAADGTPVLFYTGVRLRTNPNCGPLPPPDYDLNLPFIESQLAAVAVPGDTLLRAWTKAPASSPIVAYPPGHLGKLLGWRDPFMLRERGPAGEHQMIVGCGVEGQGGTVLLYRSQELLSGWQLHGVLCQGSSETGAMWECPLLIRIPCSPSGPFTLDLTGQELPGSHLSGPHQVAYSCAPCGDASSPAADGERPASAIHMLAVSPDSCTNPVLFWLGPLSPDGTFSTTTASGPFRLDYGNTLYAPNVTSDPSGRVLLWGWLQEHRPQGTSVGHPAYAGCLSTPRVLTLKGGRLHQAPPPELDALRLPGPACMQDCSLHPDTPFLLPGPASVLPGLDIEVELEPGTAAWAGLRILRWDGKGERVLDVAVDWERGRMEVRGPPAAAGLAEDVVVGGPIRLEAGEAVHLRVLLDHSVVEVFSRCGHVLSTRVYRGAPEVGPWGPQLQAVCGGGEAVMRRCVVHEMGSAWQEGEPQADAKYAVAA